MSASDSMNLPWHIDETGDPVRADGRRAEANGFVTIASHGDRQTQARVATAFIVKAVNAHDDLVAALTVLVQLADDHGLEQERGGLPAMLAARAALAKAKATR